MKEKIKSFLYSLATDQKTFFIFWPLKFILFLLSLSYGLAVRCMINLHKRQFFKAKKIAPIVISVGNLTLGGTGKTPLVFCLARKLQAYGKKIAILTRGYGEDEKFLLSQNLDQVPVLVGKNRAKNARRAISQEKSEALLLDDALQQWGIYKNLEIAVIDTTNPFGNGHLLPRGILREPLSGLARADIFVLSKVDRGVKNLANLRRQLVNLNINAAILETIHEPLSLYDFFANKNLNLSLIKNKEIILVSALGDNKYLKYMVENLAGKIRFHFSFIDHYSYQRKDWLEVISCSQRNKINIILTTGKDLVKLKRIIEEHNLFLPPQVKLLALNIKLKILEGEKLLNERLLSLFNR